MRLITAGAAANQVSTSERSSITGTNTTIVKKKKKRIMTQPTVSTCEVIED